MARLTVEAVAEDTLTAPEERPTNRIVASVTDPNGEPVTGLTAANFRIDPMASGNGANVHVSQVSAARLPGFYHIHVVPSGGDRAPAASTCSPSPPRAAPTRARPSPRVAVD